MEKVCGWASDAGLYIILDLHGAPGAQVADQPFTGQNAAVANFYNTTNYDRAIDWLAWMTKVSHTNEAFRNVGMLMVVNEPISWTPNVTVGLTDYYYPRAYEVRDPFPHQCFLTVTYTVSRPSEKSKGSSEFPQTATSTFKA